mgnify:CR=1 FL=1
MYPDRLILFDLAGAMAHFRKFYTNSSSLSYSFPPRTTLCGLIAGILGMPKDSYYEVFSMARCRIGLSLRGGIRKVVQTVNYIRTKGPSELDGSAGPTQVPLELVMPMPGEGQVVYRVYFWHEDDEVIKELWERLHSRKFAFPPYFGITECPAEIKWTTVVKGEKLEWLSDPEGPLDIATVILVERIRENGLKLRERIQVLKDRFPLDFSPGRSLNSIADILYERNARPLPLVPTGDVFHLLYKDLMGIREEYGVFMEVDRDLQR